MDAPARQPLRSLPLTTRRIDIQKYFTALTGRGADTPTTTVVDTTRRELLRAIQTRQYIAEYIQKTRATIHKSIDKAGEGASWDECYEPVHKYLCLSSAQTRAYNSATEDLNRAIYDYGSLSCRRLTGAILNHLPEDIRSKIVAYLTDEGTLLVLAAPPIASDQTCLKRSTARDALTNMVTDGRKHYLNWKYMGYMTNHVVTTWFRVNTFLIHDSVALDTFFYDIRLGDRFFPSIVPAEHLWRLNVALRGDMKDYEPQKRECTGRNLCIRPVRPAEVFNEHLELVLKMMELRGFRLHVMIEASNLERVEEILSAVRRVRARLMSAGVRVSFTWRGEELDGYFRELQRIGV